MAKLKSPNKTWPSEFTNYLSLFDMMKHPKWGDKAQIPETEVFESILYDMGCDLKYGYTVEDRRHRQRTENKIRDIGYVSFRERTDDFWKKNYMSVEDLVHFEPSSIAALGMRLALNSERSLEDATKEQMIKNVTVVDIPVKLEENKEELK